MWKVAVAVGVGVVAVGGYFILDSVCQEEYRAEQKRIEDQQAREIAVGKWRLQRENEAIQAALDEVAKKKKTS